MRPQFKVALPSHISPERFERTVLTALNNTPDLLSADRRSLFNACSKAAQDGLLPDGREGALVIFKDKNGKKLVQWLPMTYGLIKLMRQSGEIDSVGSRIVFAQEIEDKKFEYFISEGREQLRHEPMLWGDRGEKVLVYAYARWKDGHVDYLPMHRDDVLKRKKVSRAKSEYSPWNVWEDEMWLKTPLKALAKRMPLSSSIMRALERDEDASEFDKLKGEAIQSIGAAAAMMGAPQIEHDAETGEILDQETIDAGESVLAQEAADEAEGPMERGKRLLLLCMEPFAVADLHATILDELPEDEKKPWADLCAARTGELKGKRGTK